ncbi:MAG: hypothetical protein E7425_14030 [Ruminococcaceae bacterium]|jgi:hypothetical protein|nr:hypothetical protein [Oscillospiraceae bacterium]
MAEKTKIHCPDCGCNLVRLSNGDYFCGKCRETRTLIVDVLEMQEKDTFPKILKFLFILITAFLAAWTVSLLIRAAFFPSASVYNGREYQTYQKLLALTTPEQLLAEEAADQKLRRKLPVELIGTVEEVGEDYIVLADGVKCYLLAPERGGASAARQLSVLESLRVGDVVSIRGMISETQPLALKYCDLPTAYTGTIQKKSDNDTQKTAATVGSLTPSDVDLRKYLAKRLGAADDYGRYSLTAYLLAEDESVRAYFGLQDAKGELAVYQGPSSQYAVGMDGTVYTLQSDPERSVAETTEPSQDDPLTAECTQKAYMELSDALAAVLRKETVFLYCAVPEQTAFDGTMLREIPAEGVDQYSDAVTYEGKSYSTYWFGIADVNRDGKNDLILRGLNRTDTESGYGDDIYTVLHEYDGRVFGYVLDGAAALKKDGSVSGDSAYYRYSTEGELGRLTRLAWEENGQYLVEDRGEVSSEDYTTYINQLMGMDGGSIVLSTDQYPDYFRYTSDDVEAVLSP